MALAMAMAVIPAAAATSTATAVFSRSATTIPVPPQNLRKGVSNLSCSTPQLNPLLRLGGRGGRGGGGARAPLLERHCPRSSSYGGGEVIEAEFTPVVEQEPATETIPPSPAIQEESPAQEQGYYDQSQYYGQQGDPAAQAAQNQMEGGEDRAQYEMEGGDYDPQEDQYDEEQYYGQGYDQSQYDQQQQQQGYDQSPYAAAAVEEEQAPKEPPPHYDNFGKVMKFIALGRAMQFKLDSQKDFEMFLDKCSAYGVMIPENPSDIKRNLCELDPQQTWIVVDSRAVMKFAKKLALEEAERNKDDYPPGFVENMLNRDKYGRYKSDDD